MKKFKFISFLSIMIMSLGVLCSCSGEQGPQGEQGIQGVQGEAGKDGSSVLTGNGEPSNELGVIGDSYIDLDTWNFYVKKETGWVLCGNIKGESANANHDGTEGLEFYPISDTECAVAIGTALFCEEIIVPSYYKNYTVTSILGGAFVASIPENLNIKKVYVPKTIKSIEKNSFAYLSSLIEIEIEEGSQLTTIGNFAFSGCSALTSIEIPDSVTNIGDYAFKNCSTLTSIELPKEITSIGKLAFEGCINLQYNEFNNGLYLGNTLNPYYLLVKASNKDICECIINQKTIRIEDKAFYDCRILTNIEIPEGIISIGNEAFQYCYGLTNIEIPDSVTSIGNYVFYDCTNLTSITFGEESKLTSIGSNAFYNCYGLTSIEIPDSVTSIGSYAFYNCTSLIIYCEAESKLSGWNSNWNTSNRPVYWAGQWEYDADGNPVALS